MAINKQIIIQPKVARNHLAKFVKNLEDEGIRMVFVDPKSLGKTKVQTIFPSQNADYVISALKSYRNKDRNHETMHANASALTDQDIIDIANYFESLK